MTTRTGPAVQKLVESIQGDLGDVNELLDSALAKMRAIELQAKGINGLSGTLKAKGNEIENVLQVLKGEAEGVAKKMLAAPPKEPITEHVNKELADRAMVARP